MSTSARAIANLKAPPVSNGSMMTDEAVDRALEWLTVHAEEIGKAKRRAVKAERMVAHIEALLTKGSEAKSQEQRKTDARASDQYRAAILEDAEAAGELARLYSLREAATMRIEAWRSMSATQRAMRI